jgi:hypothetical protein
MNRERSLAHIEVITEIRPIPEKDRIVLARVLGWNVVIGKDEFKVGDKVVYVEIDSRLNTNMEIFKALSKDADRYGFALIKTRKFGGSYSQGICFAVPAKYAGLKAGTDLTKRFNEGKNDQGLAIIHNEEYADRRTEWETPKKVEPKLTVWKRILYALFPSKRPSLEKGGVPGPYTIGVGKTDEERIQNLVGLFENLKAGNITLTATEKLDGQSFTAHIDRTGKIYVASRNVPLYHAGAGKMRKAHYYDGSTWQRAFDTYGMDNILEAMHRSGGSSVTIQGEIIGYDVGTNHYKMSAAEGIRLMIFNVIIDGVRSPFAEMEGICRRHKLETVPSLGTVTMNIGMTIEKFIEMSDGVSAVNVNVMREGIVYRTQDYGTSFKAISNKFLMKRGE